MVRPRVIFDFILNELKSRQPNGIERQMVGTAGIRDSQRCKGILFRSSDHISERRKPGPEDRPNLLVPLHVDSTDFPGAVVEVEVTREFFVTGLELELRWCLG